MSIKNTRWLFVMGLIAISLLSCSEKSPSHPQHEHFEADGWVILDEDFSVVYHVWRGQSSDTLRGFAGCASPHWEVRFLTPDSVLVTGPSDGDHGMSWVIEDTTVARLERHPGDIWEFHLLGVLEGFTRLKLQMTHGDHADISTPWIPVRVLTADTSCAEPHRDE